jgi:ketosteroid isomerase-like protein
MIIMIKMIKLTTVLATVSIAIASAQAPDTSLRIEVEALNAQMVAAFKKDPATVAGFYTDAAAVIGGGQRAQGRAAVDDYWKGAASMFAGWSLETIDTGGHADAPWQYGKSVVQGRSGRTMETYFIGLLRRQPGGELKFQVDAYTRERGDSGADEAGRAFGAYLTAVERADAPALQALLDDQFVIISANARNKAQEIADLVPQSGARVEYFKSDDTRTHGFGSLAVTTGILKWRFGGRDIERNHSTILVKRGAEWKILAQQVTPRIAGK